MISKFADYFKINRAVDGEEGCLRIQQNMDQWEIGEMWYLWNLT